MRTTLATTSVSTPADQSLLVKDAYEIEGSENNTSIVDVLKDVTGDITKALRTNPGIVTKIAQLSTDAKSGRFSNAQMLSRVMGMLGGRRAMEGLAGNVGRGIGKVFGMDPQLTDEVITKVTDGLGTVERVYNRRGSYNNINNASGTVRAIQEWLGNKEVIEHLDLGAEAAFVGEMLNQAVRAGIPSAVDVLLRNAESDRVRRQIVTRNIAPIIFSGDLATMEATLKYVAPSVIASLRPNFAAEFLANFRLPFGTSKSVYLGYKTRILALLDSINPNWSVSLRNDEPMYVLQPFSRMSNDAKSVFAISSDYLLQTTIAEKFTTKPVSTLLKGQYRYLPV